eukprot:TRINITY_DN702_c0_g2_i6.p1 TRINITY_DN702_c0_g2~~TRINITY_DN702_c0_g2_i6.p1  ORF type:complete len:221 (-),score=45.75 TRINITY_DN702_c0_g2_i6:187-849(-)
MSCKEAHRYVNSRCLMSVKGALLCLCMTILGAGLYMIGESFSHHRDHQVSSYNEVVNNWTTFKRHQFQNLKVTLNNGSATLELGVDEAPDPLSDHLGTELVDYEPLKYNYTGAVFGEVGAWNSTTGEYTTQLKFSIDDVEMQSLLVQVYKTDILNANRKMCRNQVHGAWKDRQCQTYHMVSEICVQVHPGSSGWQFGDDIGCRPHSLWSAAWYNLSLIHI